MQNFSKIFFSILQFFLKIIWIYFAKQITAKNFRFFIYEQNVKKCETFGEQNFPKSRDTLILLIRKLMLPKFNITCKVKT